MSSTTQDDIHSWGGYDACRAANNMLISSFILAFSCNAQDGDCWSPESRQVDVLNKIVHSDRVSIGPDWRRGFREHGGS